MHRKSQRPEKHPEKHALLIFTAVRVPGVIGVTIKVIVVHGKLREKDPMGTQCGGGLNDRQMD